MGMFLNYQNLADNYIPNNLTNAFPCYSTPSKLDPVVASKPFEEYNAKGELVGYFWRQGETLNLEFNIEGVVTIESDAILLTTKNQTPGSHTLGKSGQRAYNIVDLRSWTCVGRNGLEFFWEEDSEFIYPVESKRSVYISAEDYLRDKFVNITLYNFRMEPIHTITSVATPSVKLEITKELSSKLSKGVYYCSVKVYNETMSTDVFTTSDCTLIVK